MKMKWNEIVKNSNYNLYSNIGQINEKSNIVCMYIIYDIKSFKFFMLLRFEVN